MKLFKTTDMQVVHCGP